MSTICLFFLFSAPAFSILTTSPIYLNSHLILHLAMHHIGIATTSNTMGALPYLPKVATPPPAPQSTTLPPSPYFSLSNYWVCASFCRQNNSNWIERFDPSNNSWSHLCQIPGIPENQVLKDFVMISLCNSMYIIGGRLCYKEKSLQNPGEYNESEIEIRSKVLRYDIHLNEWFECAPLKVQRCDFACTVCDNIIYVAGGKSKLDSGRGTSSAEMYDPTRDEWSLLPGMSTLRYKCVGVTFQGKIYVVGGFSTRVDSDKTEPFMTERSSAEVYDTLTGKWNLLAGMWQLDVPPNQIVAIGGRLFSSGDCLQAWKGHIEAYDGKLWDVVDGSHSKTLNSPISTTNSNSENWPPIERLYLTMAPIGSRLYFLAGYRMAGESSRTISMVHIFDTSAKRNAWSSFEPVEEEGEKQLCSHCCAVEIS